MVIHELLFKAADKIDRLDAEILLSHILGCSRTDLFLNRNLIVTDSQKALFEDYVQKRSFGCPVSYITGTKEFYSLDFYVGEDVLIPRPDTETLVDFAIPLVHNKRILDICCGSGCIGITTFLNGKAASLSLCDISDKALEITRKNLKNHNIEGEIFKIDILSQNLNGEFDVIVSNPPYIETDVIETLQNDVKDFEPRCALDGGKDGLVFYPVITHKASDVLIKDGYLIFEIGFNQADAVSEIMSDLFYDIKVIKDLAGNDRVVSGRKK